MKRQQPHINPAPAPKPLVWIASPRDDICELPPDVRRVFGFALRMAQMGGKHPDTKPLKGFGGAGVLEVVANDDGDTFRAVYTVRFENRVYVLDVFQKKSKSGIATPKHDLERIKKRLKQAEQDHQDWNERQTKERQP